MNNKVEHLISILMCTYNGARFLQEQLDSFEAQTHKNWQLFVSDDGSSDDTLEILKCFKKQVAARHKVIILQGPKKGFCKNFLSLIDVKDSDSIYYAYADQDDIWMSDKLERAAAILDGYDAAIPALYGSKTTLVNDAGKVIGESADFKRKPCFQNALVQSIAAGNTMLFNHKAKELLQKCGADIDVVSHDWWTYQVVSAVGGIVFFDFTPSLYYRQHDANLISASIGFKAKLFRIRRSFRGDYFSWNNENISSLAVLEPLMPEENKQTYQIFKKTRKGNLITRLTGLYKSGVFRQTIFDNISLVLGSILGKV